MIVNEFAEICTSIEEKFKSKDMASFWKEVKNKKNNAKKSCIIDGKNESVNILDIFTNKFMGDGHQEANSNRDESQLIANIKRIWQNSRKFHLRISASTIRKLCKELKSGIGHDGIHSAFLMNVSDTFLDNIAYFINSCYNHCFIPGNVLKGDINPTIKDQKGNVTESSNYRPVMQSSCLLKIIELHILSILEEKILFNFRQFGFKKGCSTTDACWILKETVYKYIDKKGKAFAAFIDLSKAFDQVDHFLLGQQLLDRSIPPDIVLVIMHYLRNQSARVCWNNAKGEYMYINKGVRQGGILSPFLFKLYIDNIISLISEQNVGCKLGFLRINIIAYADDLVLLADSVDNLRFL